MNESMVHPLTGGFAAQSRPRFQLLPISPQPLNDILASRRLLTPEHCLKLGRFFGNEPEYWMHLQNHYLFRKTQREKAA
jgi:antitoxin HigA-1